MDPRHNIHAVGARRMRNYLIQTVRAQRGPDGAAYFRALTYFDSRANTYKIEPRRRQNSVRFKVTSLRDLYLDFLHTTISGSKVENGSESSQPGNSMLLAMATYKKVHQRRVPYTKLTISSSRENLHSGHFRIRITKTRGGRSSAPFLADRSTGTAPRGWSDYGTSTRRIHSGPRYPRYWCRSTNAVSRDASHAERSANHIPLQYPAQWQMLDYHALPEDLRLMKAPPFKLPHRVASCAPYLIHFKKPRIDFVPSGDASGNRVQL